MTRVVPVNVLAYTDSESILEYFRRRGFNFNVKVTARFLRAASIWWHKSSKVSERLCRWQSFATDRVGLEEFGVAKLVALKIMQAEGFLIELATLK